MTSKKNYLGLAALIVKIGPKFFSLLAKMLKGVKIGKGGLAVLSLGSYAYMFTWQFALIVMFALFIHESGHIWAMKKCGLKTKGIYFLPFIGGAAVTDEEFPTRNSEAFIALMGPIWGIGSAMILAMLYFITENPLFAAGASWTALINIFNLLPITPLDGGRVFKSISYSIASALGLIFIIIGLIVCIVITFKVELYIFVILAILGSLDLIFEYKKRYQIPSMSAKTIFYSIATYLAIGYICWQIMNYMKAVPGSDIAMELLIG